MFSNPLFKTETGFIYAQDILAALKSVGIQKNDIIFIHSDISAFGKLCTFDRNYVLDAFVKMLQSSVGNDGAVILPTFSYSFCNGEIYNVQSTKSKVGILTEYFRTTEDVKRTEHPIFSTAIWGKKYQNDFMDISKDSFDENSVFGKLHKHRAKIVALGSSFLTSATFLHYIEEIHGVPYRYLKAFKGTIKNGEKEYEDEYTFFVRYLDREVVLDTCRLENYLLENKLMKEVKLGNGMVKVVQADVLFDTGMHLLDEDIYYFLKKGC